MKIQRAVVLYFLAGMVPTEKELSEGLAMQAKFRNATLVEGAHEHADFVAGSVPEAYEDYPRYTAEAASGKFDATAGEAVGAFFLHQVERGKWNVLNEDGDHLNDEPLNKADARALALENTED